MTWLLLPGWVQSVECASARPAPRPDATAPSPLAPAAMKKERRESPPACDPAPSMGPVTIAGFRSVSLIPCLPFWQMRDWRRTGHDASIRVSA